MLPSLGGGMNEEDGAGLPLALQKRFEPVAEIG